LISQFDLAVLKHRRQMLVQQTRQTRLRIETLLTLREAHQLTLAAFCVELLILSWSLGEK
jgi:hypothetical protein